METVKRYWMERSDSPKVNGAIGLAKLTGTALVYGLVVNLRPEIRYLLATGSALELVAFQAVRQNRLTSYYKQLEETRLDENRLLPVVRGWQMEAIVSLVRGIRASLAISRWEGMVGMGVLALALTPPCVTAWRAHREAYLEKETGSLLFGKWLGAFPRENT